MAAIDYYEGDSLNYGDYQYTKLKEVVTNYMVMRSSDDFTLASNRYQVLIAARRGIRELYYDVVQEVERIELELNPNLTLVLPEGYVHWVRLSWVDDNGHLHKMAVDDSMNIAKAYLQDDKYNYLYDDQGGVLEGSGVREKPNSGGLAEQVGFQPNRNLSKIFENGKFRVDKSRGVIEFGQDVMSRNIVLEYISDGLFTGSEGKPEEKIGIHKFAEEALYSFIYLTLILHMRNVPSFEKLRAKKAWFNNRRIAKRRINSAAIADIIQLFKGQTTWVE